ncbi:MAG: hypothetical protein HQ534_07890 [Armatimonadetes bacterium]|nr:hypothetical protein [Armatimonadota bacterium]
MVFIHPNWQAKHNEFSYKLGVIESKTDKQSNCQMKSKKEESTLSKEDISKGTSKGIEKYKNLSFMERYAMYMGVAQILELGLKYLLVDKFEYDIDKTEKWTMGKTYRELEKNKLRPDFLHILKNTVDNRNYIAHEILANKLLFHEILGDKIPDNHYDKESRRLDKFIIELEQLVFLFEWTNSNNGWN